MKSAKGQLKQAIIDLNKFQMTELSANKPLLNELMKCLNQTFEGLKISRKSPKFNEQIDRSNRQIINDPFWAELIAYSKSLGIDLIGFTEVDEYYIFEEEMIKYNVKDNVLDNAIMLGMEMKKDSIEKAPNPEAGLEAMRIYAELGIATNKLAQYLRDRGYQSQAFHPFGGPILYPPMAEKAGLGELGNNGLLITKQFGPRLRLSMIATDAGPLPKLSSSPLHIKEYCKICGICVKECPANAIYPLENKKRYMNNKYIQSLDNTKCFPQFFKTQGCSICIKVCPFSKIGYEKIMPKILAKIL